MINMETREIIEIVKLSFIISGSATLIALIFGLPLGYFVAIKKFPFKKIIISLINTGMGLPPVVVGLLVVLLLTRSGPLGYLGMLYTPSAMIFAQIIIAFPIITALAMSSFQAIDKKFYQQVLSLGANQSQAFFILVNQARLSILASVIAGFGSIVSEVGAVMMVGGNIKHQTRVLTTATVLETQKGNFELAISLGLILLITSFFINLALTYIQQKKYE